MTLHWDSIVFAECEHDPFRYRKYRRGHRRCLKCGGYKPLSTNGKRVMREISSLIMRDMFFTKFMVKNTNPKPIRIQYVNQQVPDKEQSDVCIKITSEAIPIKV